MTRTACSTILSARSNSLSQYASFSRRGRIKTAATIRVPTAKSKTNNDTFRGIANSPHANKTDKAAPAPTDTQIATEFRACESSSFISSSSERVALSSLLAEDAMASTLSFHSLYFSILKSIPRRSVQSKILAYFHFQGYPLREVKKQPCFWQLSLLNKKEGRAELLEKALHDLPFMKPRLPKPPERSLGGGAACAIPMNR